jgi:hypothetical protein
VTSISRQFATFGGSSSAKQRPQAFPRAGEPANWVVSSTIRGVNTGRFDPIQLPPVDNVTQRLK